HRRFVQIAGSERGAVDAVAPRRGADEEEDVARLARTRPRHFIVRRDADTHGIHERAAAIRWVDIDVTADGRDAERVAVPADARDDATEEVAVAWLIEWAEAECIENRDGTRAHRENVAHDAADTCRRPLIRLDRARMIVGFHLQGEREAVPDIHDARI